MLYSSFSSSSSSFLLPSLQARRRCVPHWPPLYSDARQHVKSHVRACQDKCQNTVNIIYQTRKNMWLYGRVFGSINVNILYMAETMWWFYARYMPGCFSGYIYIYGKTHVSICQKTYWNLCQSLCQYTHQTACGDCWWYKCLNVCQNMLSENMLDFMICFVSLFLVPWKCIYQHIWWSI